MQHLIEGNLMEIGWLVPKIHALEEFAKLFCFVLLLLSQNKYLRVLTHFA